MIILIGNIFRREVVHLILLSFLLNMQVVLKRKFSLKTVSARLQQKGRMLCWKVTSAAGKSPPRFTLRDRLLEKQANRAFAKDKVLKHQVM